MVWDEINPMSSEPYWGLRRLQRDMNRLFEGVSAESNAYPALNMWSSNDEAVVKAELPGFSPEKLTLKVTGDQLIIEGERKEDDMAEGVVCHRAERGAGKFTRSLRLPFEVAEDKVKASMKNGVLTVSLPRSEASRPRKIAVTSG